MQDKTTPAQEDLSKVLVQLIVFKAGKEEFAVPIDAVREIIKNTTITPIPNAPHHVVGIINVRGDIVTTVDIKAQFSLDDSEENTSPKHVIVTSEAGDLYGLLVDEVIEVLRVPKEEIKPPPSLVLKTHQKYVSAVISHERRLIILIDISKIFSMNKFNMISKNEGKS